MRIAVIGAGAWGTALSIVLGRKGCHDVALWAYEKQVRESICVRRENDLFLPGFTIPEKVTPTNSLEEAVAGAHIIVSVMPSHHCRRMFTQMASYIHRDMNFVSATKGVENDTLMRMDEIITEVIRERCDFDPAIGALSGPSFAKEVAKGDPTAITIASRNSELACTVQQEFSDPCFRVYTNDDVTGVELGGSLKNVIAIAAGVCDGLGLGHNTIAALITRGLTEITRLAVPCGGRPETLAGLAGMGDLVLTCTGGLSRNRSVGVELGRGRKLPDIIESMHGMVAEGVLTTNAAVGLARRHGVEMPITEQMYAILNEGKSPKAAIRELMTRRATSEVGLYRGTESAG
jgi:glycerol-3-phosphate dehydrogenase (NAD(P)+)